MVVKLSKVHCSHKDSPLEPNNEWFRSVKASTSEVKELAGMSEMELRSSWTCDAGGRCGSAGSYYKTMWMCGTNV